VRTLHWFDSLPLNQRGLVEELNVAEAGFARLGDVGISTT